jgi:hypothetical protein
MRNNVPSGQRLRSVLTRAAVAGALTLALAPNACADLKHRYSFNTDNDASDSIGGANGTIMNSAYVQGGSAFFSGAIASGADCDYIDLPVGMINGFTTATFEMWVDVWANGNWCEIYGFGDQNAGGAGANMLMFTPHSGGGDFRMSYAQADPGYNDEHVVAGPGFLDNLGPYCVTCVYDPPNNSMSLYTNGVLVASLSPPTTTGFSLSKVKNNHSWLGRSLYNGDAGYAGSIDELRIYNAVLNPVEVAASFISGANAPSTNAAVLGAVQALHLSVPQSTMTQGDTQPTTATVDFTALAGISLLRVPGVTYISDKPAVVAVSNTGVIEAKAAGSGNVSVNYAGKSASVAITVNPRQTGVAVAGKLWVDLHAEDVKNDISIWPNRAGEGDFAAIGAPTYVANVAGSGLAGVEFAGTDAFLGPATTSDLDGASDRSIEVWAFNPSIAAEETLVAWSHRGGPNGSNLSFNYGANGTYGAVGHWGAFDVGWSGTPPAGTWHYLVYTYNGDKTCRVFADGVLKTEKAFSAPLTTYPGDYIRIAAQANTTATDFDFGQALSGSIALVRIHGGMLSPADVANNYLYGAELTPPGALQGITLKLSAATLVGPRALGQASVTANYENRSYLNVLQFASIESSDPSVLTVDATGAYTAIKAGTATLKASYSGKDASVLVTVLPAPATELKHRYSFNEAPGTTTVKDSAGTADGLVKGNGADFTGTGQIVLPGGGGSADAPEVIAGYVDLPNHIVNVLVNPTFETWVTWNGSGSWQRIFDFGTSDGGEDISNGNGNYFFLSPAGNVNLRFAVRDPRTGGEPSQSTSAAPLAPGEEIHITAVYNFSANEARLYSNAVLVASSAAPVPVNIINDVNNWLGRSQWGDAMFAGSFNEFRIWEGALTAEQVAANDAAGPNTLPSPETSPSLVVSKAGSNVVIAWPATSTFALQAATAPSGMPWQAVDTSGAVVENSQKKLTLAPSSAATFYRMKK